MSPRVADTISSLADQLSGKWKMISLAVAAGIFVFSITGTVKAIVATPAKIDQHILQDTDILHELKLNNCLTVAQLRKTDWTLCLVKPDVD